VKALLVKVRQYGMLADILRVDKKTAGKDKKSQSGQL